MAVKWGEDFVAKQFSAYNKKKYISIWGHIGHGVMLTCSPDVLSVCFCVIGAQSHFDGVHLVTNSNSVTVQYS